MVRPVTRQVMASFAQKLGSVHLFSLLPFLIYIRLLCSFKINWCFSEPFYKYYGPNSDLVLEGRDTFSVPENYIHLHRAWHKMWKFHHHQNMVEI